MEGGIVLRSGVAGADGQAVRLDLEPDEAAVLAAEINSARQDVGES